MTRIGIIGGRGYVGEELLRLIDASSHHEAVFAASRSTAGKPVREVVPGFSGSLKFSEITPQSIRACKPDAWIIAQDNGQAAHSLAWIPPDIPVVDVSSDYRFDPTWVYGLPEKNEAQITPARRVANPGCYATAVQLALLPLQEYLRADSCPVAFGISGFSGAGRTPSDRNNPERLRDNVIPYSLSAHAHQREVRYQLNCEVRFVPHVAAFFRGLSITLCVELTRGFAAAAIQELFSRYYEGRPMVEIADSIPEIAGIRKRNVCRIGGFSTEPDRPSRWTLVSVLDNLRKGAASQALENVNLMTGLPSHTGLIP